jgi:predicted solute-binding protein
MTTDFATSNLSKIKTKFRTSGNISQPRRKAGSALNEIGMSTKETIKCATQDEYLNRLYYAFDKTDDNKLKQFIYTEIRNIHVQRGTW